MGCPVWMLAVRMRNRCGSDRCWTGLLAGGVAHAEAKDKTKQSLWHVAKKASGQKNSEKRRFQRTGTPFKQSDTRAQSPGRPSATLLRGCTTTVATRQWSSPTAGSRRGQSSWRGPLGASWLTATRLPIGSSPFKARLGGRSRHESMAGRSASRLGRRARLAHTNWRMPSCLQSRAAVKFGISW